MSNPFAQFQNDTIRIISKDRKTISDNLKAHVTPGLINLYQTDIDVTDGDFIERDLPNNRTELFEILESNYHEKFNVIDAHYTFKVKKTTSLIRNSPPKNTYNVSGNNVRIYNNSIDHSNNTINHNNEKVFDEIKTLIIERLDGNNLLLDNLNELQLAKGGNSYLEKYKKFISCAADHMTLIGPFIPTLTAFIGLH